MLIDTTLEADSKAPAQPRSARNRWHAVMVLPRAGACAAAQSCRSTRYLSSQAPRLPLADCDAARCDCRYRHYTDRRGAPRRKDPATAAATERTDKNRRGSPGRRRSDRFED